MHKNSSRRILSVLLVIALFLGYSPITCAAQAEIPEVTVKEQGSIEPNLGGSQKISPMGALPIGDSGLTFTNVVLTTGGTPVEAGKKVKLEYTWEINNSAQMAVGDTVTFQLTESFSAGSGFDNGIVTDNQGKEIGRLTLSTGGTAVVTFRCYHSAGKSVWKASSGYLW